MEVPRSRNALRRLDDTPTRLEQYIRKTGMPRAALARQAGISRQHLLRLRRGLAEPTRDVMVRLALAASALRARRVFVADLFELTETEDLIQEITSRSLIFSIVSTAEPLSRAPRLGRNR